MKFRVSMKDPDTLWDSIREAVDKEVSALGLEEDEATEVSMMRTEAARSACGKWFKFGEYLTVDIDTEAGTCTVVAS